MCGVEDRDTILRCLPADFLFSGARIMDFGCGVGRVLRHFGREAADSEFWACDIDGQSVHWVIENMTPPFRVFQSTRSPVLPLESGSFDLIYAISVFTHMHEDWHAWLMELRRILKHGGFLFLTFLGEVPFQQITGVPYDRSKLGMLVKDPENPWDNGGPTVFHSPEWIAKYWGNILDIEFIALNGLMNYQSICMTRKPPHGRPAVTRRPRIFEAGVRQALSSDAQAHIIAENDVRLSLYEAPGLIVRDEALVKGWVAFKGDRPANLHFLVDGAELPCVSPPQFFEGEEKNDWPGTRIYYFSHAVDMRSLADGIHELRTEFVSAEGRKHWVAVPLSRLSSRSER